MNQEVKAKWLEALRSGKYKQTTERLHDPRDDGYCCLGVLCDLHSQATNTPWDASGNWYLDKSCLLPKTVVEWAGLPALVVVNGNHNIQILLNKNVTTLSELNDDGFSFVQIADLIEQQL